jgi:fermentation-respiration switch protein FrsA (DUF1100 family)
MTTGRSPRSPTRIERLVFVGSSGLVAAHTVVDAFLAPQQGTSWTDHLSPGLAPLVLLAAANLRYARLSPGARAAIAAVLGIFAIEGAGLALADASRTFGRASDWTGFLLGPAGLALLALAVLLLWRSRKASGRRYVRRVVVAAAVVVGAYWLVVPVAMALYATHRPRAEVKPATLGAPYRPVTVRTADGLDLTGWYVRSRNGAAVISFPTRLGKLPQARMLIRHRYGVLILDMRGYEGSDGTPNAFGWGSTKDIDAAVAWLQRQPDVQQGRIGGIGYSVGGEQMLEAAAENPGLKAVVSEGAGERSVRETLIRGPRGWLAVPAMAAESAALTVLSQTLPPPSLEDAAARIAPRAVFFVYAEHGVAGEELNRDFYRAAAQPKSIWRIPEAHHTGGLEARPAEYERRVVGFLDHALLK